MRRRKPVITTDTGIVIIWFYSSKTDIQNVPEYVAITLTGKIGVDMKDYYIDPEDSLNAKEIEYIFNHHNRKCIYCKYSEQWHVAPYRVCHIRKDKHCLPTGCRKWEWDGQHPHEL